MEIKWLCTLADESICTPSPYISPRTVEANENIEFNLQVHLRYEGHHCDKLIYPSKPNLTLILTFKIALRIDNIYPEQK